MLTRVDFIRRFVKGGLTYAQAHMAYQAVVDFFEDGIASRSKIRISHVGVIKPIKRGPRSITMGFKRDATGMQKIKRNYLLGTRVSYTFRVYRAFGRKHDLYP